MPRNPNRFSGFPRETKTAKAKAFRWPEHPGKGGC